MRKGWPPLLSIFLLGCLPAVHAAPLHLQCEQSAPGPAEAKRIARLANGIVKRDGKHVLSVHTAGGTLRLVDKPPHDEPLSGVHYTFCDRRDGFILIAVDDEALGTGLLVNEASGQASRVGHDILFSPDRRAYLAMEQPDGMDGARWKIHAVDGTLSWSGYSFIPREGKVSEFTASLDTPAWTDTGEFTAMAQCVGPSETRWKVKLIKAKGSWQWLPKRQCPRP